MNKTLKLLSLKNNLLQTLPNYFLTSKRNSFKCDKIK